jgi:hypothetical protein
VIAFLLMLACAPAPDDLPCREDFTRAADGHCYPDGSLAGPSDLDDVFDLLEPCTGLRPGGLVDFESGCAGDLCEGDLFEVVRVLLGEPEECVVSSGDAFCTWANGLGGRWDDEDDDGLPDPGSRNQRVQVRAPWVYGTSTGLGIWMPPSCFVDALGPPDEAILVDTEDGVFIERLDFDAVGLLVYDLSDLEGRTGADGLMELLFLYGAP